MSNPSPLAKEPYPPHNDYQLAQREDVDDGYNPAREEAGQVATGSDEEVVTKLELAGWLIYGFGNEPYYTAVVGVFIPLILESLAASSGFQLDGVTPCNVSEIGYQCVNYFGASLVDTASYSLYITCVSVIIQFFVFVQLGALADHGANRKKLLLIFTALGVTALVCFLALNNPAYYNVTGTVAIFANVTFGASIVFWYAYLPALTRNHPQVLDAKKELQSPEEFAAVTDKVMNTISSHGFAVGYLGGCFFLLLGAIFLFLGGQGRYSQIIIVAAGGLWWGFFTIFTALWLRPRPGSPLPEGASFLTYSWRRTWQTVRQFRRLSETFKFLITWFILSDGINTTTTVAVFFAQKQLGMTNTQLIVAAIMIPFAAAISCYLWLAFQRVTRLSTKSMIILLCSLWCLLPIYGLIGFLDVPFGIKSIRELYIAAVYEGLILGAVQSFCRVMFSELIPRGHENEFFSLYEVTDKGSSWLGPLVIGLISDVKHDMRYGFYWILASCAVPIVIVATIDVAKGKRDAAYFVRREEMEKEILKVETNGRQKD